MTMAVFLCGRDGNGMSGDGGVRGDGGWMVADSTLGVEGWTRGNGPGAGAVGALYLLGGAVCRSFLEGGVGLAAVAAHEPSLTVAGSAICIGEGGRGWCDGGGGSWAECYSWGGW